MYSFSDCLAHQPNDYLKDHLKSVAKANQCIWEKDTGTLATAGIFAGLLHDIGKANRWFQDRINGKTKGKSSYSNHSLLSAVIGWYLSSTIILTGDELNRFRLSVFIAILRHHSNLKESWAEEIQLIKHRLESSEENYLALLTAQLHSMDLKGIETWLIDMVKEFELPLTVPELKLELIIKAITSVRPLRIQNCFKELEDAVDFLCVYSSLLQFDKIHSAAGTIERKRVRLPEFSAQKYINECIPQQYGELTKIRNNVSAELEKELSRHINEHFFTVTAPTGSGKTLAILNATLKLRKYIEEKGGTSPTIIYCLPFTSIIDQNYAVYREVLENAGLSVNSELLLKHHHLSDPIYISSDPEFDVDDSELFTETWMSEIIVTTFHQLLHGIITSRNKNLKRFISLKDAIVILDEVQAIPHRYWEAIRKLFQIIGKRINTRFILMTATQPLLFSNDMAIELLPQHEKYFEQLSRITLVNRAYSDTTLESFFNFVSDELEKNPHQNRMCVLNRKSSVYKLYSLFKEQFKDRNIYALSANLTPKDRKRRIEEIRETLGSSDFSVDKFKTPLAIEKLCKVINDDNYNISLNVPINTLDWLNELLKVPDFYDILHAEKPNTNFSKNITDLVDKTKDYRNKGFSLLNNDEQGSIKRLNRLILEKTYPQETPKSLCLIITTQLIEAGVDISVDIVDRDIAPLDSIIQSAGRCNRHGNAHKGIVNLWSLVDNHEKLWKRVYDPVLIDATKEVLTGKPSIEEKEFLELGRNYFKIISERTESDNIDDLLKDGKFSEIENYFILIEDDIPRQSYFVIQSPEDREIWEKYKELEQIENPIERKKAFGKFKAAFMERIIQVNVSGGEGILPLESKLEMYSEELGFVGNANMPGSIIL